MIPRELVRLTFLVGLGGGDEADDALLAIACPDAADVLLVVELLGVAIATRRG